MDFNCLGEGEKPDWKKYCHFSVRPCVAVEQPGKTGNASIGFEIILLEEVVSNKIGAEVWTVFGIKSDGETDVIHDSHTREQAKEVVEYCLNQMNDARSHKIIANEVISNFSFDIPELDPYKYDAVETRPVKFYPDFWVYEECEPDDNPTAWSVYGHVSDEKVGGSYCIHDCATEPEMKQLAWVLESVFNKN